MDSLQLALDLAAYVLVATFTLGLVFAAWLVWSVFFDRRFKQPRPAGEPLPNPAVDQLRTAQAALQALLPRASGADRKEVESELRRLEKWRVYLEDRLERENEGYMWALRRLERGWQQWKEAHDRVWRLARDYRAEARQRLRDIAAQYRELERHTHEERQKAVHRNREALTELQGKHLLNPPVLARLQAAHGAAGPVVAQGAAPAHAAGATLADGAGHPAVAGIAPPPGSPQEGLRPAHPHSDDLPQAPEAPELDEGSLHAESLRVGDLADVELPPLDAPESAQGARAPEPAPDPYEDLPEPPVQTRAPIRQDESGPLHAGDFALPAIDKAYRVYGDGTLDAAALPPGGLARVDLRGTVFQGVVFSGAHRFRACDFTQADLRKVTLAREKTPHRFIQCAMEGARFTGARIAYALFYRCDLRGTDWRGVRLDRVKFEGCDLEGADWRGVNLSRTVIEPLPADPHAFALAMKPPFNAAHPVPGGPRARKAQPG